MFRSAELVHVTRGPLVESIHYGDVAVVDASGKLIAYAGAPKEKIAFWRSSAKPFLAVPVVESGAVEHFGLTEQEMSVFCASHNGELIHTETVERVLQKIGLSIDALQCGTHEPLYLPRAKAMREAGIPATAVHNNCSGKHAGMLTLCQQLGADPAYYTELRHPVQQLMLQSVSEFTGLPVEQIPIGIDGCGVPVHGLSVYNMALAWARLANPSGMSDKRAAAVKRIRTAMMHNPQMIAGSGRLCTALMSAAPGRIVAKSGAEAVYGFAIPELGWGVSLKIADGNSRGMSPVVIGILKQLAVLTKEEMARLEPLAGITLHNHRGDEVGELRSAVQLVWI